MSEHRMPVSVIYSGGDIPSQVLSIALVGGVVVICEHTYQPAKDPGSGDVGECFESVIGFEIGAIDAVIRELRKVKRSAEDGVR